MREKSGGEEDETMKNIPPNPPCKHSGEKMNA